MTKHLKLPTKVPKQFYPYFWDIDPKKLDPSKRPFYVINRLLDKGNLEAARWALKHFPRTLIIDAIKKTRDWSLKSIHFLTHLFHIPKEVVKCMQEPYLTMRRQHWPY